MQKYRLKPGDLLVSEGGDIGRSTLWNGELKEVYIQNAINRVRPRDADCIRFLYYWLYAIKEAGYIDVLCNRSTIAHYTAEKVNDTEYLRPPTHEQRAIADFLDRKTQAIDELIHKKERLIELLQEKRQALITQAVTKGLDPNVPMKDSGIEWLGEIPAHWATRKIKHVASILRGKFSHRPRNDPRFYDGPYPFIQTGDIARAEKHVTSYTQTLNREGYAISKQFPRGTLVMAIAANIGDVAILDFDACFPDSVVGFIPKPGAHVEYLYYLFLSMRQVLASAATVNTQGNLNVDRIGSLHLPIPPRAEQHQVVRHLNASRRFEVDLMGKILQQIDKLREYRQALISAAVTGKIDVRSEAA